MAADLQTLGYRQELKRSLRFVDLFIYGLILISPTAPFSVFGVVFNASNGMVPLVYLIGLVAMTFTALSYMTMSRLYPVAGSVYTYTSRSLGAIAGFFSGWVILLDYILAPTLAYVVAAIALEAAAPAVPRGLSILAMILVATAINYFGIEATARVNEAMLVMQLVVLALFCGAAVLALAHGVGHFSWTPFYRPGIVTPGLIFGALSLAVLSFLGFDAVSTLSEESRSGAGAVGRATMASMCAAAALFITQTFLASLFTGDRTALPPGPQTDGAFYVITGTIGGPVLKIVVALTGGFLSAFSNAIATQAAAARLIYGMARDRTLPGGLAVIDERRKVPARALLTIAALAIPVGLFFADRLELLTSMVSFGAIVAFFMLHLAVIAHGARTGAGREAPWRFLAAPAIGLAIIGYVLWNAELNAKLAGAAWLALGVILFVNGRRRRTPSMLPE